jgi:hypothetical protein
VISLLLGWALAAAAADAPAETPAVTAVTASLVVKVGQPADVADALVAAAEEMGGWFQTRSTTAVSFRLPSAQVDAFLAEASALGVVADRQFSANDLTTELVDQRSRLAARESVLDQYYAILATANPKAIVSVERQITQLVEEIEDLKGRIRYLEHQGEYARVDVSFQFRDRRAPSRDGSSSFAWLNTLNLEDMVNDFQYEDAWWKTAPADPATPAGFSAWKKHSHFRAVTPDGVLYRVRSEKHEPKGELPFWKEALKERMVAAGYQVAAESDATANGVPGAVLELRAPLGEQDWTYLVAVFPNGGKLVLVEAAAEISKLEPRKAAILEAVAQLGL